MSHISPESPEERGRRERRGGVVTHIDEVGLVSRGPEVLRRAAIGVWSDGFIHAGNLAYLALITLFPMVIVLAAVAHIFGHGPETRAAVDGLLDTMPQSVAVLLEQPIEDVLRARTGMLLWLGAGVGLWTVVGFIVETVRDILHRAYGTRSDRSFLHYRLRAIALIVLAMVLALVSFSAQIFLTALEQFVYRWIPIAEDVAAWIGLSRLVPLGVLTGTLYFLFYALTPSKYRKSRPKWPGAIFTALWWAAVTLVLPQALSLLGGYDLTYGSLAGVMIALLFFWLVGLGLVFGAHLNAALAETPSLAVKDPSTTS